MAPLATGGIPPTAPSLGPMAAWLGNLSALDNGEFLRVLSSYGLQTTTLTTKTDGNDGKAEHLEYVAFALVPVFFIMGLLGILICHVLKKKGYRCTTEAEQVEEEKLDEKIEMNETIHENSDTVGEIVNYIMKNEGFSLFLSFPQTLYNIHRAHLKKTLKNNSLYEGLLPLVSPLLLFVLLTVWVILSPGNILAKQPRLFLWMVGVAFSNVICKVIVCQMSSTQPELFHWFLFPLALVVYAAISGLLGWTEEVVLAVFTVLVTAAHVHYGVCVGKQLSEHLNIYIFSLKKRVQE